MAHADPGYASGGSSLSLGQFVGPQAVAEGGALNFFADVISDAISACTAAYQVPE